MKTVDSTRTTNAPQTKHPETSTGPTRTGVLGTILTEVEFGEDERLALQDARTYLSEAFDALIEIAAFRGRDIAIAHAIHGDATTPDDNEAARPSIRSLRKHAARQWLTATFEGTFDAAFSRQVRHTWMPILLAEQHSNRATPAVVGAYLDYLEGAIAARLVSDTDENIVPHWRMLHGVRTAIRVQRRLFGLE